MSEYLHHEVERRQRSLETMAAEVLDRNQRIAQLETDIERLRAAIANAANKVWSSPVTAERILHDALEGPKQDT